MFALNFLTMNLRKHKAAKLKLGILDQTLRLIGKKPFQDLHVKEICKRVKVSKVTFFNYFPMKEDVLLYYHRIWCFRRTLELTIKPKHGLQGIYFLADKLADDADTHPGLIYGLLGYLGDIKRSVKPFAVKPEEKSLLYPDRENAESIEIRSLEQMIEGFVLEAIFRKEITTTTSTRDLTNVFHSILYGSLLVSQLTRQASPGTVMRRNLDLFVKGLS